MSEMGSRGTFEKAVSPEEKDVRPFWEQAEQNWSEIVNATVEVLLSQENSIPASMVNDIDFREELAKVINVAVTENSMTAQQIAQFAKEKNWYGLLGAADVDDQPALIEKFSQQLVQKLSEITPLEEGEVSYTDYMYRLWNLEKGRGDSAIN